MNSVVIYLRVSTDGQDAENQLPELERLCRSRGWDKFDVRSETASGAKKRPVLDALCADVHRGRVRTVVVWALDRLGRTQWDVVDRIRQLDACQCALISAREPWLDLQGPTRGLLISVFAWWAEQERNRLRDRTNAGLDAARAKGKRLGRPPLSEDVRQRVLDASARIGPRVRQIARELGLPPSTVSKVLIAHATPAAA